MKELRKCYVPPYQGDEPYVFFSYCHTDRDTAYPVIEHLRSNGLRVWYDQGIVAGADWPEYIAQKLQKAEVCIIAMSKAADESINCNRELAFAAEHHLSIVVVYLEECSVGLGTQLLVAGRQSFNAHQHSAEELLAWLKTAQKMASCWGDPVMPSGGAVGAAKKKPTVSVSIGSWSYDGRFDSRSTLKIVSDHTEQVQPEISYFNVSTGSRLREAPIHAGRYRIRVYWQSTQQFDEAEAFAEFEISKCPVTLRVPDVVQAVGESMIRLPMVEVQGDASGRLRNQVFLVECRQNMAAIGTYPGALTLRDSASTLENQYPDYTFKIVPGTLRVSETKEHNTVKVDVLIPWVLVDMNTGLRMQADSGCMKIGAEKNCDFVVENAPAGEFFFEGARASFRSSVSGWLVDGTPIPVGERAVLTDGSVVSCSGAECAVLFKTNQNDVLQKHTIFALKSLDQNEMKILHEGELPCGRTHNGLWKHDVMPASDRTMSGSHHCEIVVMGDTARLRDWKSTNGTYINDVRYGAQLGLGEWCDLHDGDMVRMGHQHFRFYAKTMKDYVREDPMDLALTELNARLEELEACAREYKALGFAQFDKKQEQWKTWVVNAHRSFTAEKQINEALLEKETQTQASLREQLAKIQSELAASNSRLKEASEKWHSQVQKMHQEMEQNVRPAQSAAERITYQNYLTRRGLQLDAVRSLIEQAEPLRADAGQKSALAEAKAKTAALHDSTQLHELSSVPEEELLRNAVQAASARLEALVQVSCAAEETAEEYEATIVEPTSKTLKDAMHEIDCEATIVERAPSFSAAMAAEEEADEPTIVENTPVWTKPGSPAAPQRAETEAGTFRSAKVTATPAAAPAAPAVSAAPAAEALAENATVLVRSAAVQTPTAAPAAAEAPAEEGTVLVRSAAMRTPTAAPAAPAAHAAPAVPAASDAEAPAADGTVLVRSAAGAQRASAAPTPAARPQPPVQAPVSQQPVAEEDYQERTMNVRTAARNAAIRNGGVQNTAPAKPVHAPTPIVIGPMVAVIELQTGKCYFGSGPQIGIGSDIRACDIALQGDSTLAKHHADVIYSNGTYYIRDNRSTNGVFVNGKRLPSGSVDSVSEAAYVRLGTVGLVIACGNAVDWVRSQQTLMGLFSDTTRCLHFINNKPLYISTAGILSNESTDCTARISCKDNLAILEARVPGAVERNGVKCLPNTPIVLQHGDQLKMSSNRYNVHFIALKKSESR